MSRLGPAIKVCGNNIYCHGMGWMGPIYEMRCHFWMKAMFYFYFIFCFPFAILVQYHFIGKGEQTQTFASFIDSLMCHCRRAVLANCKQLISLIQSSLNSQYICYNFTSFIYFWKRKKKNWNFEFITKITIQFTSGHIIISRSLLAHPQVK